ncbi:recombination regulator RecX [Ligilactobacillus equi DSM 15833 = JCM 10991]|uniref:Regulatory protein RecX n=3 Tax=Ligilactobacillus equi TaxID=137357 RepID=V7HTR2_9LACO|nr:recombination regulator RecX [Ligilactobacillus equi DPC 6820]KRL80163.1 recombination regulator RecX [Ligilactobacillus equi DSM 15833 = JCM 10991]
MIQAQKRPGRYNIYLDGQYRFAVSEDTLLDFELRKGLELEETEIDFILQKEATNKFYNKALTYLSSQLRTEKEIVTYLSKQDALPTQIDVTIQKLKKLKLVDDNFYARSYVRTMAKTSSKGPNVIANKLRQKGLAPNDIEDGLSEYSLDDQLANGLKLAQKLALRYHKESFFIQKQKINQGLIQNGFGKVSSDIMDQLDLQEDEDAQNEALQRQGQKIWQRNRRFDLTQRKLKTRQALYRKGFSNDEISHFLEKISQNIE